MPTQDTELQAPLEASVADRSEINAASIDAEDAASPVVDQNMSLIPTPQTTTPTTNNRNEQVPGFYPGFAFCKFIPGKMETAIRVSILWYVYFMYC